GHCNTPNAITCAPFLCDPTSSACYVTCSGNSQCISGKTCMGNSCGLKPLGSACTGDAQCDTPGHCADGVCCNSACTGACQACNVAPGIGACVTVTSGTTPRCMGNSQCDGSGNCLLKNGQSCSANGQCLSGACIGSVCCNNPSCTGGCQ